MTSNKLSVRTLDAFSRRLGARRLKVGCGILRRVSDWETKFRNGILRRGLSETKPSTGFEPATSCLRNKHSTAELRGQNKNNI